MKIYKSTVPPIKNLTKQSIYSYVFSSPHKTTGSQALPAYVDVVSGRSITYEELEVASVAIGEGLKEVNEVNGLKNGTAMIFSPNSLDFPLAVFSLLYAGITFNLANSSYTSQELSHQLNNSDTKMVLVHPALLPVLLKAAGDSIPKAAIYLLVPSSHVPPELEKDGWRSYEALAKKGRDRNEAPMSGDETAWMCYSSGTTGLAKGVETTHFNITSNVEVTLPLFPPLKSGKDNMFGILPFYHIFGITVNIILPAFKRLTVAVMPKFDITLFCKSVERYKISFSLLVPPILVALATCPEVEKYNMTSLKTVLSGAAPLGKELIAKVEARGSSWGISVIQGYGMTETSPVVSILPGRFSNEKAGSCGLLCPNLEARLIDEDGKDAENCKVGGELWLRSTCNMRGYWKNKVATDDCLDSDGWLKTGDVAVIDDDGCLYIIDRRKELIKYKGFQVAPADLEGTLLGHPAIADVGVIGVYDDAQATELPRAYVVPTKLFEDESEVKKFEKEIAEWVEKLVAPHKRLRGGCFVVKEIPKLASGKILRRELRAMAAKDPRSFPKPKL